MDISNFNTSICVCKLNSDTKKVFSKSDVVALISEKCLLRCCLCLKYYHKECVEELGKKWTWFPLPFHPSKSNLPNENNSISSLTNLRSSRSTQQKNISDQALKVIGKFICPLCQKSSRPTPEQLLTLLLSLEKLDVQIFEGQLVQNIIERFLDWQHRTKHSLQEIGKEDLAVRELLEFNQNTEEYPKQLEDWIGKFCGSGNGNGPDKGHNPPKLSSSILNDLINMQVEGDLIEVKLPESDLLWLVIRRFGLMPKGCGVS